MKRVNWDSVDLGKGVCRRKRCEKFVGKNDRELCDMHEHYRINNNNVAYHKRPEYKERAKKRLASLRLKLNKQKTVRRKKDTAGLKTMLNATGAKLEKAFEKQIEEVYR